MRPENRLLDLMEGGGLPEGDPGTWKDHGASMREIRDRPFWNVDFAGRETHTEKETDTVRHRYTHTQKRGDQALEELGPISGPSSLRQGASCGSHCPRREG